MDVQQVIEIREATSQDLSALLVIELQCFHSDRLSQRSFRRFISEKRSDLFVLCLDDEIVGYYLLIYRLGSSMARLYSIAVVPRLQGQGLAKRLIADAEQKALLRHCVLLRLEVRPDNQPAIKLYQKLGYHPFGVKLDFYEDHSDALCLQKQIHHYQAASYTRLVPYIAQTTPFTCGPACLLMAFNYFQPGEFSPEHLEIELWREATTIFMTSGHGGCGPRGLALAAAKRGFIVQIYLNQDGPLFLDSVRSPEKKSVMQRVYQADQAKVTQLGLPLVLTEPDLSLISKLLKDGYILLALISTWQFDRSKAPHWIVICAVDADFVYINDPDVEDILWLSPTERHYIPVSHHIFNKAFAYGKKRLKALLAIKKV